MRSLHVDGARASLLAFLQEEDVLEALAPGEVDEVFAEPEAKPEDWFLDHAAPQERRLHWYRGQSIHHAGTLLAFGKSPPRPCSEVEAQQW